MTILTDLSSKLIFEPSKPKIMSNMKNRSFPIPIQFFLKKKPRTTKEQD